MKVAGLLIFLLSNQGYWVGGEHGALTIHAAVQGGMPSANLSWVLMLDSVKLQEGTARIKDDGSDVTIDIKPPKPRTRVTLQFVYRVIARADQRVLETGQVPINVFEAGMLGQIAGHVRDKSLVVWDRPAGLPAVLKAAKIPFTRIDTASELLSLKADALLVGADILGSNLIDQSALDGLVASGSSVMIFRQSRPDRLMRYALHDRIPPAGLKWRLDHPLLVGFTDADLRSWTDTLNDLKVVQLPTNEPALEIGYCPAQVQSSEAGPIDAVLLTKTSGRGRVVLCQIPLGSWETDGRSQLLLRNAIDFLLTRPEPTPRPKDRTAAANQPQTRPSTAVLQY